jgi:hypothetical protein
MQKEQLIKQIIEYLQACKDENFLDFILKLLIESSY